MSRITKWKLEKTKVKVVFRLQFHATHIPQSGWDKLFISFIPADSGKASAKTTKANVRNGTCKWADPIYETTRLLQDVKTKRYDEKLYKLVVAMGSSRSSVLGEASINLADYADALKPSVAAIPLHGCDFGTVLHVTVQLLTSKTGFREFEQQRELRERGLQTDQNSPDESSGGILLSSEDAINDQMDKVSTRVRFKEKAKHTISLGEEVGLNEDYADSAVGFDGSSNTSESLYAEKHDSLSTHEVDSLKSTVSGDIAGHSPQLEKGDHSDHQFSAQGASDWVHRWSSDYSADNDLAAAYDENIRLRGSLEVAESSILELKLEVSSLQGNAEEIGYEAQRLAKQLAAEVASGEELAKEVSLLKSECSNLKADLQQLKLCKLSLPHASGAIEAEKNHMLPDFQLRWLKGLLAVEDKIRELQNKACFGFHEMDLRCLHTDLEALLGSLEILKQGSDLAMSSRNLVATEEASLKDIGEISLPKNGHFVTGTGFDVDSYQPELGMLHCLSVPGLVSHESELVDATNAMKAKYFELLRELDESKSERESLAKKMGQMECYYEALVQELEENQRQMLGELQNLRNEHSACLYTVSSTKSEMEMMRQDLNDKISTLSEDKHNLDSLNKELERRAVTAEAALKRARLNYSIAVDQLQKDLEVLSLQVSSMFETNENIMRQTFVDSSQLNSQNLDPERSCEIKLLQCENEYGKVKKQQLGGDILSDDLKKSLYLQEGLYLKVEGEVSEMHFANLYLDVFSKTLQETLLEAADDVKLMKEKLNELGWQLELSTESKELLMQKLHAAMGDVHSLNEYKATCIAKFNDMTLQNQILEAKLQDAFHENHLLMQKVVEWESLVMRYKSYESKYEACAAERTDLACLLESKSLENSNLQNEIFSLQKSLKDVKNEFDELASVKENLQNLVHFLRNKLQNLLASYKSSIHDHPPFTESGIKDLESRNLTSVLTELEEFQHNACEKILQLTEEKKVMVNERDIAQASITAAEQEIELMKCKFGRDIRNMVVKLDVSNVLVQKLQFGVETVAKRFKDSSEVEERHAQMQTEFFSILDHLEVELQEVVAKNTGLSHEILALETLTDELGRSKLTAVEFAKKNQDLMASLLEKGEESTRLASEMETAKESLQVLREENQALMIASQNNIEESAKLLSQINSLKENLQSLHDEKQALVASSCDKNEEAAKLASELNNLKEHMQSVCDENEALKASLSCETEKSTQLTSELISIRDSFQSLHDEQSLRVRLESKIEDLTSQLNEKQGQLLLFDQNVSELVHLKQMVSDLQSEKSRMSDCLVHYEECLKTVREESSSVSTLETLLSEMNELLMAVDIRLVFTETQYKSRFLELVQQLSSSDRHLAELQQKHIDVEAKLNQCLVIEAQHIEENARLLTSLNSCRSELEAFVDENKLLIETNKAMRIELDEYNDKAPSVGNSYCENENQHSKKVEQLKHRLVSCEEEIDSLMLSKEELEVRVLVLEAKFDEQKTHIILLEGHNDELLMLKKQCNELMQRLSEQMMKTEEFRNLSIHFKELKDKADAECVQAREKREPDGPPVPMQDSLRVAFIKEQYEGRLQELKQQLSISKKHSEEMLWKLQDAIDEIEKRKRSEASHLKKNEELGMEILELEAELQSMLAEKREKTNAYDLMKAEMECSLISLECCKEEKQKLEDSLQECTEEKSKIAAELDLVKQRLENSKLASSFQEDGNDESYKVDHLSSNEPAPINVQRRGNVGQKGVHIVPWNDAIGDPSLRDLEQETSKSYDEAEHVCPSPDEVDHSSTLKNMRPEQDVLVTSGVNGLQSFASISKEKLLHGDMKQLAFINDHFKAESLMSSMDNLNNELERMKNENSLMLLDDNDFHQKFPGLQNELTQLQQANEELGSMYPLFDKFSRNGNALERVLALEIELAEALQKKKGSSVYFQSSFLKQHSDEEAIFKSFRDINDLIKDMLELKGRYSTMETELKDMHDRYSELSLEFAEVEGERQKLMMTLKNVRASKKAQNLSRSSSATRGDFSS